MYADRASPRVRERRASLAIISATGGLLAAVPCVLRALLHIFPIQNCHFFSKSPFFALKRNVKRPCGLQTYIFPMTNQHFSLKIDAFSLGGLGVVLGWSGGAGGRPGALPCSVALVFFKNNASHAAWRSFWAAGVAPAVGPERSHAAWRSFLSKTMLPMQRGARARPRGCMLGKHVVRLDKVSCQHVLK